MFIAYIRYTQDGLSPQCISSFLFLYFACLAPIVAFGGLLGEATNQKIATIEGLMAGLLSGVLFALFSGQPLNLLGTKETLCSLDTQYIHHWKLLGRSVGWLVGWFDVDLSYNLLNWGKGGVTLPTIPSEDFFEWFA